MVGAERVSCCEMMVPGVMVLFEGLRVTKSGRSEPRAKSGGVCARARAAMVSAAREVFEVFIILVMEYSFLRVIGGVKLLVVRKTCSSLMLLLK